MQNNFKLLALDLDGTIVSRGNKISKKNINAMRKFVEKGNKIAFITGRPFYTSKSVADYFFRKTGIKIDYICSLKGSLIYDNINENILFESAINEEIFNEIYNIALKNDLIITGYSTFNPLDRHIECYNLTRFWKPLLRSKIVSKRFGKIYFNKFDKTSFYKLNLIKKKLCINFHNIKKELEEKIPNKIDISITNNLMIEITNIGLNKAFALKYLCKLLNLDLSNTIAFGDSGNDVPMLEIANISAIISSKKAKKMNFNPNFILNKPIKSALSNLIDHILNDTM